MDTIDYMCYDTYMDRRSQGFVAIETIAMVLLVVLVLIVAASLTASSSKQSSKAEAAEVNTSESFQNKLEELQNRKKYELLNTDSLFSEEYEGVPFNERLFMEAQAQYTDGPSIQSTRFEGKIVSVTQNSNLIITMVGLLETVRDKEVQFIYNPETLPKITVSYGSLADLKVGDSINIDETNDVSKNYQDSIVSIAISPIQ